MIAINPFREHFTRLLNFLLRREWLDVFLDSMFERQFVGMTIEAGNDWMHLTTVIHHHYDLFFLHASRFWQFRNVNSELG